MLCRAQVDEKEQIWPPHTQLLFSFYTMLIQSDPNGWLHNNQSLIFALPRIIGELLALSYKNRSILRPIRIPSSFCFRYKTADCDSLPTLFFGVHTWRYCLSTFLQQFSPQLPNSANRQSSRIDFYTHLTQTYIWDAYRRTAKTSSEL